MSYPLLLAKLLKTYSSCLKYYQYEMEILNIQKFRNLKFLTLQNKLIVWVIDDSLLKFLASYILNLMKVLLFLIQLTSISICLISYSRYMLIKTWCQIGNKV